MPQQSFELAGIESLGQENLGTFQALRVKPQDWAAAIGQLKERGFDMLIELSAADYSKHSEPHPSRFGILAILMNSRDFTRIGLKAYPAGDEPALASLCSAFAAANWYEREIFDMFGVRFEGHPDLRRILMYEGFEGHPLRKDYPLGRMQPLIPMREAVDYEQVRAAARRAKGEA